MDRRTFLRSAAVVAAGGVLSGCDTDLLKLLNQGEEQLWGMNVHPYGGELGEAQIEVLRSLGIRRVRITLGLHSDLAGNYLRRFQAEYIGLVGDYNDPHPSPSLWPGLVRQAVERSPGLFCYEILNEPTISPGAYVEQYLRPAYEIIKAINPAYRVAAAAPPGTSGGLSYFYQMTEAGADSWCDFRAAHLYSDHPEAFLKGTRRPFLITESGVLDPSRHVDWYARTMTHLSGVLETDRVYFYTLADQPDTGWAIISSQSRPGRIGILSPLHNYIKVKYGP